LENLPLPPDKTMANSAQSRYRIGDHIKVRRQRWRVTAVEGHTLTLRGVDRDNADQLQVLVERFERIEVVAAPPQPLHDGGPPWRTGHRRWRRACREMLCRAGSWTSLGTIAGANLTVWPHQLGPARAVLAGQATRLLLADAVGLGKTIQAGVVVSELIARGVVTSALVLCPAGLRDQWQEELRGRFALDAVVFDCRSAARQAAELPLGVNPWKTQRLAIASVDYIKRPEILPAVRAVPWDLVIVDEAHGVSPGSDRYAAVAPICSAAVYVILVTATPHSGDREAFAALLRLGAVGDDPCLVFRRSRADVRLAVTRRVHQLRVGLHAAEETMHAALDRYASALRSAASEAAGAELLLAVLRKRGLSSPASLRSSVERRLATLDPESATAHQARLPIGDGEGEFDASDEMPLLPAVSLPDPGRERQLLGDLRVKAATASAAESKLRVLARLLRRLARRQEPAIVFTEFRDTLLHVQERVAADALLLHGGLDRRERRRVVDAFAGGDHLVLLATDAGGEGLNLHQRCRCVIHLEVPWNPVRLEQRTGRVDRIGQRRRIHVFCLVARHPSEALLLQRIQTRVDAADDDVGMTSPLVSLPTPEQVPAEEGNEEGNEEGDEEGEEEGDGESRKEAERIEQKRRLARRPGTSALRRHNHRRSYPRIVARSRPRMRPCLHGRGLALIEWVAVDHLGRLVAADVSPVAVPVIPDIPDIPGIPIVPGIPGIPVVSADLESDDRAGRQHQLVETARAITPILAAAGPTLSAGFSARERGFATRQAFWSTAAGRAEAVSRALAPNVATLFQPGLFDRRSERLRQLRQDEHDAVAAVMAARAARFADAREPPIVVAHRLLLLLP
jgi:superfamily II DNA or RNA helicase